jgi:hypothetical protein
LNNQSVNYQILALKYRAEDELLASLIKC